MRSAQRSQRRRMLSMTFAAGMLAGLGLWGAACGGSSTDIPCDPADPTCSGDASVDDGSLADAVLLGDGALLLPDGRVIPPPDGWVPPPPVDAGPGCKVLGAACGAGSECCTTLCTGGVCAKGSFCSVTGDACTTGGECCTGVCTAGRCGPAPTGPSYCGKVDGELCGGCTDCCSRVCAPYGTTGVKICQPAEGCHVVGDLCTKDGDCCGAAGTGLPGAGHVTCDIAAGAKVGICRNPLGCNPEGAVCHYKSAATCGTDSARNDCCDALGSKGAGVCKPDAFGVPRCNGGGPCVPKGGACAYSGDCCDGVPCVPDSTGALHCYPVPPGSPPCVPVTGPCTVDADCCVGGTCSRPPGSTTGTCKPVSTPPPPPPPDAGTDTSTTDTSPPPPCALFGQTCKTDGDCCGGVPCTDKVTGTACAAGVTTCTCHYPLK